MFKPMAKETSSNAFGMLFFWVIFIVGMAMVLGPGGLLLGVSIPIILSECVDRLKIAVYNGKETDKG